MSGVEEYLVWAFATKGTHSGCKDLKNILDKVDKITLLQSYYKPYSFYRILFVKQTNNCTQSQVSKYTTFFLSGWHMYLGSALSALRWEQRHAFILCSEFLCHVSNSIFSPLQSKALSCINSSFYLFDIKHPSHTEPHIQNILSMHSEHLSHIFRITKP